MLFLVASGLASEPALPDHARCLSPHPPVLYADVPRELPPAATEGGSLLEVRDAFGDFQTYETAHFAIKWGTAIAPDPANVEAMAADLEAIWERQVVELGWPAPPGTDAYKLNVYIADSGPGLPTMGFPGGFVDVDPENQPFVAVSSGALDDYGTGSGGTWTEWVLAHEFNHALQMHSEAFLWTTYGPWFWEATSNWVVPETQETGQPELDWGVFLLNPHISLEMWSLDAARPAREARQYDAAIFLHHLTSQLGQDVSLVRDLWVDGTPEDDPLAMLDARLEGGIRATFVDFAVTYATGDHDLAARYEEGIALYGGAEPDNRITDLVPASGTTERRPPNGLRPQAFAWNQLAWEPEQGGEAVFELRADTEGSDGSPSAMEGRVVRQRGGERASFAPGEAFDVLPGDRIDAIVVAVPETYQEDERFGYAFAFNLSQEPDESPGEAVGLERGGCGCATSSPIPAWLSLLLGLVALVRRRER